MILESIDGFYYQLPIWFNDHAVINTSDSDFILSVHKVTPTAALKEFGISASFGKSQPGERIFGDTIKRCKKYVLAFRDPPPRPHAYAQRLSMTPCGPVTIWSLCVERELIFQIMDDPSGENRLVHEFLDVYPNRLRAAVARQLPCLQGWGRNSEICRTLTPKYITLRRKRPYVATI